jgi:hypothetical protein
VLEQLFSSQPPVSLDGVVVTPTQTLRGTVVNRTQVLQGRGGLGLTTVSPTQAFNGAKPQLQGLPQLAGGLGARAEQVRLNGGPQISGLASHYGANLFGSR